MSVLDVLREVYTNLAHTSTPGDEDGGASAAPQGAPDAAAPQPEGAHPAALNGYRATEDGPASALAGEASIARADSTDARSSPRSASPGREDVHVKRERLASVGVRSKAKRGASKKRKRKGDDFYDDSYFEWTDELMAHSLPAHAESMFATAVFELGLKQSSPKVLMKLMPDADRLTTEHIKSHLQKHRLHYNRSKDEFLDFFELRLKDRFRQFCAVQGWRNLPPRSANDDEDSEPEDALQSLMDSAMVGDIQDLSNQIVQEQMKLQQILQCHIMAQVKLQGQIHDQLAQIRDSPN